MMWAEPGTMPTTNPSTEPRVTSGHFRYSFDIKELGDGMPVTPMLKRAAETMGLRSTANVRLNRSSDMVTRKPSQV
jgi:hypothetical protein